MVQHGGYQMNCKECIEVSSITNGRRNICDDCASHNGMLEDLNDPTSNEITEALNNDSFNIQNGWRLPR